MFLKDNDIEAVRNGMSGGRDASKTTSNDCDTSQGFLAVFERCVCLWKSLYIVSEESISD